MSTALATDPSHYDYHQAFSRNQGIVSKDEQEVLRNATVAILGCGGIGSTTVGTLARMGIGRFILVDPDTFDLVNMNRQGALTTETIGDTKVNATAAMIHGINPTAEVITHAYGVDADNVEGLIEGADLILDAIDFFSMEARQSLYPAARKQGIPVIFSAPLGLTTTISLFMPDGMRFEDYFDIRPNMSRVDLLIAFLLGIAPKMAHRSQMDMRYTNLREEYGPSLSPACAMGAGLLATLTLKVLLHRPRLRPAPHYLQFDAYNARLHRGRLLFGNRSPWQRIKRWFARKQLTTMVQGIDD